MSKRYNGTVTYYNLIGRVGTAITVDHAGGISIVKLLKRPSEIRRMFGISDISEIIGKQCVIEYTGTKKSVRQYKFISVIK